MIPSYSNFTSPSSGCAEFDISSNGIGICVERYSKLIYFYNFTNVEFSNAIGIFNLSKFPLLDGQSESITDAFISSNGNLLFLMTNYGRQIAMFEISNVSNPLFIMNTTYPGSTGKKKKKKGTNKHKQPKTIIQIPK